MNKFHFFSLKSFLLVGSMLYVLLINAQIVPENFSRIRSGEKFKSMISGGFTNTYIDTVTDDKYADLVAGSSTWRPNYKHKKVTDRITISIKDTTKAMDKFDYLFYFTIDTFDALNRRGSFNIIMRFSYDPESHKAYTDKSVFQFSNSHRFIIKVTNIKDSALVNPSSFSASSMMTNFTIESEIIVERYYLSDYSIPVSSITHSFVGKDKLRISWTPPTMSGPNQYELEWTYIDTAGIHPDSIKYNFSNNSSRVKISAIYYDINTVYDAGVILYRVRRVRPDSVHYKYLKYSNWKPTAMPSMGYVSDYTSGNKVYINSHESMQKNWDYQVAFAEEGLKKEVVNYFDGSLKRRQGVTLSNTNHFALVDESIYDFHGREVIKIIPAPSDSNTIKFYKDFNLNTDGDPYSASDFDTSTIMEDKCNGNYKARPVGAQSGAGRYYSTSNPDKTNENAAIPDAQGYPLVQTQLMPDPTGRVVAQGGIGIAHQLGSGHETKYTYGTSTQIELDKVFGSEMGVVSHYKKNAVIDPNGQMSISYIDQHGRVIATSLTGGVPGMVDTLENYKAPNYVMLDLASNGKMIKNALVTTYGFNVTNPGTHKIYYKLESPDFLFGCLGLNQCYSCRYDFEVTLSDGCGNQLLNFKRPIGLLSDLSCSDFVFTLEDSISSVLSSETLSSSNDSISFYLGLGEYYLSKVLTVNTDSIEEKINAVIFNDSNCFKTISDFIDQEMEQIDFDACACDTCETDTMNYCMSRKQLMLEDLSFDGQYFEYDENEFTVSDPTSILRSYESGRLYQTISGNLFKDENGKIDTVWIGPNPYQINELDIVEFIENYKPSWTEALLPLHPEYCYYKYCIDSLQPTLQYDEEMMDIENYDTALYYGFLNPLGNNIYHTSNFKDPFFVNSNGTLKSAGVLFNRKLHDFSDYTVGSSHDPILVGATKTNLWQFSSAIGHCEYLSDSLIRESCFKFYYADTVMQNNWMNDAQGKDLYWEKFKSMYFQMKHKFLELRMYEKISGDLCVKNIGSTEGDNSYYDNKVSHFTRYHFSNPIGNDTGSINSEKRRLLDSLSKFGVCEANVNHWDDALSLCENYNTHRDSILYHLLLVCKKGSTNPISPNIFGSMDVPEEFSNGLRFTSFEEVLIHFIGVDYKNELCNLDLINAPRSFTTNYESIQIAEANECVCKNIKNEINSYKGCFTVNDSAELGTEGKLVNDFMNGLVANGILGLTDTTTRVFSTYSNLVQVANNLFAPLLGGSASYLYFKLLPQSLLTNEKVLVVYRNSIKDGCRFSMRMSPNGSNFTNINTLIKSPIIPLGGGSFSYTITKTGGGGSFNVVVNNTCFVNFGKCSSKISVKELPDFTNHFNRTYGADFNVDEMTSLLSECGSVNFSEANTDSSSSQYIYSGGCPDYYQNYKQAKDKLMISFLNEMMRNNEYWRTGMTGFESGDQEKRHIDTYVPGFHCIAGTKNFLTQTKDYNAFKYLQPSGFDNYWWVSPKFSISTISASGLTIYDTIYANNYNNDPHFVGGFWIGYRCDAIGDSSCFTSFGDPYKQLGTSGRSTIPEIDSLSEMRWSYSLSSWIVSAFDRANPNDSVILTIRNQCKPECRDVVRYTTVPIELNDVLIKPGKGGLSKFSGLEASVALNYKYINPFMDMINGLAKSNYLVSSSPTQRDIRQFRKSYYLKDYYKPLIPTSGGYLYKNESYGLDATVFIGRLGVIDSTDNAVCRFGFKKTGSSTSWNFSDVDIFKDFGPDPEAIAEAIQNDREQMAGFHFTLKAGIINSPGDTSWYPIKGWNSCWNFSDISAWSGQGKGVYRLPESFTANCVCLSCIETNSWSDSLFNEYPNLHRDHSNYQTIVTNYINRKLNTNLSFTEIQSHWDECGLGLREFIKIPMCSYRIAIKNTDCVGHADSMLEIVMQKTGSYFGVSTTRYSDSSEYCLDFIGMTSKDIAMVQDSLNYYFSSPFCSANQKYINYRRNYDIILYRIDSLSTETVFCTEDGFDDWFSDVKTNLFASSSNLSKVNSSGIYYNEGDFDAASSHGWLSKITFNNLTKEQRKLFIDTLEKWTMNCGGFEIIKLFQTPKLQINHDDVSICFVEDTNTLCYGCDSIKSYIRDYQYSLTLDTMSYAGAMLPVNIGTYLEERTGNTMQVYSGAGTCLSCSNSSLYVCEDPTIKTKSIIELLSKVAKAKKLNSSNYLLNSSFTSLLNTIKPTGVVLDSSKYKYSPNTLGGWSVTIQYNTKVSDVLFFGIDTNDFQKKFNPGIDTFLQFRPLLKKGIVSGFSITGMDSLYRSFNYNIYIPGVKVTNCCEMPMEMLCPKPYTREFDVYEPPCKEDEVMQAILAGTQLYYQYLDSIKHSLKLSYQTHCLRKAKEDFRLGAYEQRYHTTLYYYDQAGNLIKTVPPQGVSELNMISNRKDSITAYRKDIKSTKFVNTQHILGTVYRYNSLNQLVWQKTPDGGESNFWYDRLGRLVLSQNAVQIALSSSSQKIYSYTRYDALGRICELGEISQWAVSADSLIKSISYYNNWLAASTARTQITKTFYDYIVMPVAGGQFSEGQRNLRGRVSSIAYYDGYASDSTQYTRSTNFSYDIHGNVDHLVHDFPDMAVVNNRFKHITYKYDLISGEVHSVAYQAGEADQWFHRFGYDADCRLTYAETSTDSVIWDRDAEYKYYKHGPLARIILGEHAVQGLDYVYTIHGWLKGVNSNTLVAGRDVGKDGYGGLRRYTARDVFGFTLGYYNDLSGGSFDGDYKSIGSTAFEANTSGSPLASAGANLYNGNISHMVSAVNVLMTQNGNSPFATSYRYDQLNRIKSVYSYNGIDINDNEWNSGSLQTAFHEKFSYDANGNIKNLLRYSATSVMDKLSYNYKSRTNQLTSVDDTVSSWRFNSDIDDETAGNYRYDRNGNLTYDRVEQIDSIHWNVYGKISEIKRTSGSTKPALSYRYDAMGHRVLKIVKHGPLESSWDYTWYVRDAQGNVMATYNKQNRILNATDTSLYRQINNSIIDQMNGDSLAAFIRAYFEGSQFYTDLSDAVISRSYIESWVDMYPGDTLLDYDNEFAQDVLEKFCDYYSGGDRTTMHNLIWDERSVEMLESISDGCVNLEQILAGVLMYDNTSNVLLNALATLDMARFDFVYQNVVGIPPPLPPLPPMSTATKIANIRSSPDVIIANAIKMQYSASELETIIEGLSSTVQENAFLTLNFCDMMTLIANCAYGTTWFDFVYEEVDQDIVKNIIAQSTEQNYLASLLFDNDTKALNKLVTLESDLISDALRKSEDLDILTYMMYIYKRFGRTVFNQVIEDLGSEIEIQKTLTLSELHIYGSSRHGIHKPKKIMTRKNYVLEEIEGDGILSFGTAQDSTFAKVNYRYFKRTLTLKEYELTNHLGNILATVLDRKTAITDLVNDTLKYYNSDVSTAQYYYAFGSRIQELKFQYVNGGDTAKYRYGFNGMEKDDGTTVEGGSYDFGARIYDSRLGKWLSLDPLTSWFAGHSPYNFCFNDPICLVDEDGLKPRPNRRGRGNGNNTNFTINRNKASTRQSNIWKLRDGNTPATNPVARSFSDAFRFPTYITNNPGHDGGQTTGLSYINGVYSFSFNLAQTIVSLKVMDILFIEEITTNNQGIISKKWIPSLVPNSESEKTLKLLQKNWEQGLLLKKNQWISENEPVWDQKAYESLSTDKEKEEYKKKYDDEYQIYIGKYLTAMAGIELNYIMTNGSSPQSIFETEALKLYELEKANLTLEKKGELIVQPIIYGKNP